MYIDTYAKHTINKGVYLMYKGNEIIIKIVTTKVSLYEDTKTRRGEVNTIDHSVIYPII